MAAAMVAAKQQHDRIIRSAAACIQHGAPWSRTEPSPQP